MKTKSLRLFMVAVAFVALTAGCSKAPSSEPERTGQSAPAVSSSNGSLQASPHGGTTSPAAAGSPTAPAPEKRLPRMVDIGAGTCIPCRMMAPILDDLKHTRAHQFETVFVDLNHERQKAMSYRIRVIPTQVFYDGNGRELGRHEGFMSKEQILKTWEGLGFKFDAP